MLPIAVCVNVIFVKAYAWHICSNDHRELKLTSLIKVSFLDFLASSDAAWGGMTTSSMLLVTSGTAILEDKQKKRTSVSDLNAS